MVSPCTISTLTLPNAVADATITAMSGLLVTGTFTPATNDKEIALTSSGYCGNRVYSIVEVQPATFISIVSPAPANLLTTNWTLNLQSNSLADVQDWVVTLKAEL